VPKLHCACRDTTRACVLLPPQRLLLIPSPYVHDTLLCEPSPFTSGVCPRARSQETRETEKLTMGTTGPEDMY